MHQMFSVHATPEEFKNATGHLDLCLRNARAKKSHDYGDYIFEKLRFQKNNLRESEKLAFSNSFGLKSVFEKRPSRDGLVCTVGQTK